MLVQLARRVRPRDRFTRTFPARVREQRHVHRAAGGLGLRERGRKRSHGLSRDAGSGPQPPALSVVILRERGRILGQTSPAAAYLKTLTLSHPGGATVNP